MATRRRRRTSSSRNLAAERGTDADLELAKIDSIAPMVAINKSDIARLEPTVSDLQIQMRDLASQVAHLRRDVSWAGGAIVGLLVVQLVARLL